VAVAEKALGAATSNALVLMRAVGLCGLGKCCELLPMLSSAVKSKSVPAAPAPRLLRLPLWLWLWLRLWEWV
jgi:hypothetical protein